MRAARLPTPGRTPGANVADMRRGNWLGTVVTAAVVALTAVRGCLGDTRRVRGTDAGRLEGDRGDEPGLRGRRHRPTPFHLRRCERVAAASLRCAGWRRPSWSCWPRTRTPRPAPSCTGSCWGVDPRRRWVRAPSRRAPCRAATASGRRPLRRSLPARRQTPPLRLLGPRRRREAAPSRGTPLSTPYGVRWPVTPWLRHPGRALRTYGLNGRRSPCPSVTGVHTMRSIPAFTAPSQGGVAQACA